MAGNNTFPDPAPGPPGPLNPPPGPPAPYESKQSTTGGNENENWAGLNAEGRCQISRCHGRSETSSPPLPTGMSRMTVPYIEKMDINHQGGEVTHGQTEKMDIDSQRGGATHGYTEGMDIDPICPTVERPTTYVGTHMEEHSSTPKSLSALFLDTIVESGEGRSNASTEHGAGRGLPEEQQAHGRNSYFRGSNSSGTVKVSRAHSVDMRLRSLSSFNLPYPIQAMDKGSWSKLFIRSPLNDWGEQEKLQPIQIRLLNFLAASPDLWMYLPLFNSHYPGSRSPTEVVQEAPPLWQFIMGIPLQPDFLTNASTKEGHSLPPLTTILGRERFSPRLFLPAYPIFVGDEICIQQLPAETRPMFFRYMIPRKPPQPPRPYLYHRMLPEPCVTQGWLGSDPTRHLGTLGMKYTPEMLVLSDFYKAGEPIIHH